jgi:hypothetical protein
MKRIHSIILSALLIFLGSCSGIPGIFTEENRPPELFPDITEVTIPVNIAPMNFRINESSEKIIAVLEGTNNKLILRGRNTIKIPGSKWRKLLEKNSGSSILVTLYTKNDKGWVRYLPFRIYVKETPIDPVLVYRLIAPGYEAWSEMGIYQRDLTTFKETPVIDNRLLPGNCMNCHSFNQNDPGQFMFHLRGNVSGTMLVRDGVAVKLNTKTRETISNCVYPYWHPSGSYIAYSVNSISQFFHTVKGKRIEVMDSKSDLVVFDINANKLITSKLISSNESFETFPAFSPDGRTLFFCSARAGKIPDEFDRVRYSLCKIDFDPVKGIFGNKVDTLVSTYTTAKSISFPRPSGDGRYLMFTLSDYGNFSIWHKEADLCLLNLGDGTFRPLDSVNSDDADSYHSWSSDSHWFVFSSRRIDGLYTRPYFAWLNENGEATKPFLLPQKDPGFYDDCLRSFNVPELVKEKVMANGRNMLRAIGSEAKNITFESKE